jgi:hypothetical protein
MSRTPGWTPSPRARRHVRVLLGGHLASLSALDLTGVIAALTVVFLVGGRATIRRVTV